MDGVQSSQVGIRQSVCSYIVVLIVVISQSQMAANPVRQMKVLKLWEAIKE